MKRCPQCNRLESDDALVFCRTDGTLLISDTDLDAGTMRLGSGPVAVEAATNELAEARTNISNVRSTGPTTNLSLHTQAEPSRALFKLKSRPLLIGSVIAVLMIAAAS